MCAIFDGQKCAIFSGHWHLRYRAAEIRSVRENAARLIVIRAKNATGSVSAEILVKGYRRISRFAARRNAPFIAAIYGDGRVREYPIT